MNRRFALVIGNELYEDAELNSGLHAPRHDVEDFAEVLQAPNIGAFEVTQLVDRTFSEVRDAICEFLSAKQSDDTLLIYFSGHAVKDRLNSKVYLAVKDTSFKNPRARGIDSDFLRDAMSDCYSQRQILILDCCYSGAFARGTKSAERAVDAASFVGSGYGQVVITASTAFQEALEADQVLTTSKHSLFTHYLIEGLRTGDADGAPNDMPDGSISEYELYSYVYKKLDFTKRQTPQRRAEHQGPPIIVAKNLGFQGVPDDVQDLLRAATSSSVAVRTKAIEQLKDYLKTDQNLLPPAVRDLLERNSRKERQKLRIWRAVLMSFVTLVFAAGSYQFHSIHQERQRIIASQVRQQSLDAQFARLKDVYFDYDTAAIDANAQLHIREDAALIKEILKASSDLDIVISGHHDDHEETVGRTIEIGQQRALAVQESLIHAGIPATKLRVVDLSSAGTTCTEQNEECWQRQRNVHFSSVASHQR